MARIGLFAAGLMAVFAAAVAVGSAFEPADTESGAHEEERHASDGSSAHAPAGLSSSAGGYTLRVVPSFLERGEAQELRFQVSDIDGEAVTDFDELHERRMHLIVVRRDGSGFRHLHPEIDGMGTWSTTIEFVEAGAYRVFADFSVGGEQHTLAQDVFVSGGGFDARPFPPPAPTARVDGYEVELHGEAVGAGMSATLDFAVSRDGEPVELAPYLGANGHLVALREGDLAFLHVHPEDHEGGEGPAGEVRFAATFPSPGRYRLYLQFKHDGAVHTAEFTVVGGAAR